MIEDAEMWDEGDDDEEEEDKEGTVEESKEVVLDEYLIETDEESAKMSSMYATHAKRLREAKKVADDDEDEAKEALENAFISLQFGTQKKQNAENEKRAAKLMKKYEEE